ncbi:MAG: transcription factor TFIIIB subunit brf1 [Icmadophila ericetorum]|nr:transcription factor TFIIIB subunit brf1 [Icmadophila ericetorum]
MSANPKSALKQQPQRALVRPVRLESIKSRPALPLKGATRPTQARRGPPTCTNAACDKSDVSSEGGHLVCRNCGTVVRDDQITSDVSFGAGTNGAVVMQGAYVGENQSYARSGVPGASRISGGMDSREISEANGRRIIRNYCSALQLPDSFADSGMQVFKLALGLNFVQGRETKQVAAVCLYTACRRNKENKLMLVDLSEMLKINVYDLGRIYNALVEQLGLRVDGYIQPIHWESLTLRFAQKLEFAHDTQRVSDEACRIIRRMDRDWMTPGRRPSGLCAAALILAARMNNYRRSVKELVYLAKVTDVTISKRLEEFKLTQAAELTVKEFRAFGPDLERAADPPAFYQQFMKKKKKRRRTETGTAADEQSSEDEETQRAASIAPSEARSESLSESSRATSRQVTEQRQLDSQAMPPPPVPIDPALLQVSAQRLAELEKLQGAGPSSLGGTSQAGSLKRKRGSAKKSQLPTLEASQLDDAESLEVAREISGLLHSSSMLDAAKDVQRTLGREESVLSSIPDEYEFPASPPNPQSQPTGPGPYPLIGDQASPAATQTQEGDHPILESTETAPPATPAAPPTKPKGKPRGRAVAKNNKKIPYVPKTYDHPIPDTEIIPDEEFANDPEIENCLLTPEEFAIKERIWLTENGDYLRAQQAKLVKQQLAEANGTARVIIRRKRRRGRMGDSSLYHKVREDGTVTGPTTPAEATAAMLAHRGYSTKINYAAIENLYDRSNRSSSGSSRRGSIGASGSATPLLEPPLIDIHSPTPLLPRSSRGSRGRRSPTGDRQLGDVVQVEDDEEEDFEIRGGGVRVDADGDEYIEDLRTLVDGDAEEEDDDGGEVVGEIMDGGGGVGEGQDLGEVIEEYAEEEWYEEDGGGDWDE